VTINLKKALDEVHHEATLDGMTNYDMGVIQTLMSKGTQSYMDYFSIRLEWASSDPYHRLPPGYAVTATLLYCPPAETCVKEALAHCGEGDRDTSDAAPAGAGAGSGSAKPRAPTSKDHYVDILAMLQKRVASSKEDMRAEELMGILKQCSNQKPLCTFPPHVSLTAVGPAREAVQIRTHVVLRPWQDASTPVPATLPHVRVVSEDGTGREFAAAVAPPPPPPPTRGSGKSRDPPPPAPCVLSGGSEAVTDGLHNRLVTPPGFTCVWEDSPSAAFARGEGFHGNLLPYLTVVQGVSTDVADDVELRTRAFVLKLNLPPALPATGLPSVDIQVLRHAFRMRWLGFLATQAGIETTEIGRLRGICPSDGKHFMEEKPGRTAPLVFSAHDIQLNLAFDLVQDTKLATLRTPLMTLATLMKFLLATIKADHLHGLRCIPAENHILLLEVVKEKFHECDYDPSDTASYAPEELDGELGVVPISVQLVMSARNTAAFLAPGRIPRMWALAELSKPE
jgi:hypothetical protein